MQAEYDDRTESRQIFSALSHPELMELPASAAMLLAATGSRVVPGPAYDVPVDGAPTDGFPSAGVPTGAGR